MRIGTGQGVLMVQAAQVEGEAEVTEARPLGVEGHFGFLAMAGKLLGS